MADDAQLVLHRGPEEALTRRDRSVQTLRTAGCRQPRHESPVYVAVRDKGGTLNQVYGWTTVSKFEPETLFW